MPAHTENLTHSCRGHVEGPLAPVPKYRNRERECDRFHPHPRLEGALLSVSEQIDTRSAGGRLVLNVLASVSQWEREAIGERTSVAMQHKAAIGEYTGGAVPYGLRLAADGMSVEREPAEEVVITEARRLRASGLSLRAVAPSWRPRGTRLAPAGDSAWRRSRGWWRTDAARTST